MSWLDDEIARRRAEAERRMQAIQDQIARARQAAGQALDDAGNALGEVVDDAVDTGMAAARDLQRQASSAYDEVVREVQTRTAPVTAFARKIQRAVDDPAGFVEEQYRARQKTWTMTGDHFESPPGTLLTDPATFWYHARAKGGHPPFPTEILYKRAPRAGAGSTPRPTTAGGDTTHLSDDRRTLVYLDVGRWGGSKVNGSGGAFDRQRDFGIVYGKTAVLCEYRSSEGSPRHVASADASTPAEADAINNLLARLDGAVVVKAMASNTTVPAGMMNTGELFIFVGDMHLPITTNEAPGHTRGDQMGRFEIDDALLREGSSASRDALNAQLEARAVANPRLAPALRAMKAGALGIEGTVGRFDIDSWLHTYEGADIFERANGDLNDFVSNLETYQSWAMENTKPQARLVQLGDMFDFWVGMLCYFLDNPMHRGTVMLDPDWVNPTALQFADWWANKTAHSTARSAAVEHFLRYRGPKNLLYGNHDNYFSPDAGGEPAWLRTMSGTSRAKNFFRTNHFFSEHGHQNDDYNKDGAREGWALTQAAFRVPTVRSLEPSSRLARLKDGCELWIRENNAGRPFCHYVMGHTHVPVIARVTIRDL